VLQVTLVVNQSNKVCWCAWSSCILFITNPQCVLYEASYSLLMWIESMRCMSVFILPKVRIMAVLIVVKETLTSLEELLWCFSHEVLRVTFSTLF
jgi:hypothetical protein